MGVEELKLTVSANQLGHAGDFGRIEPGMVFIVDDLDPNGQSFTLASGDHYRDAIPWFVAGWYVNEFESNRSRFIPDASVASFGEHQMVMTPWAGRMYQPRRVTSTDGQVYFAISHHPIERPQPNAPKPRFVLR